MLRRCGSGREIPAYIILTELGEVDFGLTSRYIETDEDGRVFLKLLPYSLEYYKSMVPEYSWPEDVKEDENGNPVILLKGLKQVFTPAIYSQTLYDESVEHFKNYIQEEMEDTLS